MVRPIFNAFACAAAPLLITLGGCSASDPALRETRSPFPADARVAVMRVNGLSCPLCAHNIHQQLMRLPGVRGVRVDLGAGLVTAGLSDASPPGRDQLARAIDESGFSLVEMEIKAGATKVLCSACQCKDCSCVIASDRCGADCSCHS